MTAVKNFDKFLKTASKKYNPSPQTSTAALQSTVKLVKVIKMLKSFTIIIYYLFSLFRSSEPRILVSKKIMSANLVQNNPIIIRYDLHNTGEATAYDITLNDTTFPESFTVLSGSLRFRLEKIDPSINVLHAVIVSTNVSGQFDFEAAKFSYSVYYGGGVRRGSSSAPGPRSVKSYVEYVRMNSMQLFEWSVFVLVTVPSLLVPFALWYFSKRKYENLSFRCVKNNYKQKYNKKVV